MVRYKEINIGMLSVLVLAGLSHRQITDWMLSFSWMKLGREICQCQQFGDQDFCDNFKIQHKVHCLEYDSGYRMVVKQFNGEELQTMYNPTPGRGLAFIRVFKDHSRQEWRRKRSGEITIRDYDKTFHIGQNTTEMCNLLDSCRTTEVSVDIFDGKFLWLTY